jgi:selenocysteine lyase/cysteine desulfurase
MFQPAAALFYQADPVLPYPQNVRAESRLIHLNQHSNSSLVQAIKESVHQLAQSGTTPGCVLLPQVSKTGRLLPVKEVAAALDELRAEGVQVYLIVDAIQSIGRTAAEEIVNPLSSCDAFIFGSSKALGGLLIASTVIMKRPLLDRFLDAAQAGKLGACPAFASHFQFEPDDESRLPATMLKPGAISIPEVVAMREAVRLHYYRGEGKTYAQRRLWQLDAVCKQSRQLKQALAAIDGVEVLEAEPDRPIVDSIVCFKPPKNWSPNALKDALQEGSPIVTPSASIGRYVRLDIPEYRQMPSIKVLVSKIKQVLASS